MDLTIGFISGSSIGRAMRLAGMAGHHRSCCTQQVPGHRNEAAPMEKILHPECGEGSS